MYMGRGDNVGTYKPVCNNDCTHCKSLCILHGNCYELYRYNSCKNRAIGLANIQRAYGLVNYTFACPIKHNRGCK